MALARRTWLPLLCSLLLPHLAAAQARDTLQRLDTIRVTSRTGAAAASATRSVEVLTRDDLSRLAGRSLAERLGRALGVDVGMRSPAQADLSLRGSSVNQVVVLVDGVRVSDVQSGHYALDLAVPMAMVERVEILRGTGAALYGSDAVGGVVNIVTRDDDAREASLRGGSFGTAAASALNASRSGAWRLAFGGDGDRSSGHRDGTDYDISQLRASAERHTALGRTRIDVGQGLRRFGAADFYSPFPSEETTRSTTAAVQVTGDDTRPVTLGGSLHTRRHHDVFTLVRDDPARYQNEHLSWETGGDVTAQARVASGAALVLGADVLDARLRSARLGNHEQLRRAAFGELTLDALPGGTTADLALRGDRVEDIGGFLSPTLGVAMPLGGRTRLRGSVSRGFRAATWTERYYQDPANIADSSLAVERFWSSELGLRAAAGPALVDVAVFDRQASDLIDWARPTGSAPTVPWRTMNFASARYRGAEGAVRLPDAGGIDWTLRASGLRFDAAAARALQGKYALRPLTRTVGVVATRAVGEAAHVTVDALRTRRAGEGDVAQVGARADAPLAPGLRASLELVNLGNASALDASGKPIAGRSVYVGVAWSGR